jgi:hypothetical protein
MSVTRREHLYSFNVSGLDPIVVLVVVGAKS